MSKDGLGSAVLETMPSCVDMMQIDWIENVPKVLCLQLNRLNYTSCGLIKHKHRVTFDKQIFVDRFLLRNAAQSERISSQVAVLRE